MQACALARPQTTTGIRHDRQGSAGIFPRARRPTKSPDRAGSGLFLSWWRRLSGGRLEQLAGVGLDRLGSLRGDLLRKLGELLAPGGGTVQHLLRVVGPQAQRLGGGLPANN